ncbi:MAG: hypothetical protein N2486_00440 [Caloramator sp.]|nr:hypothetical protein [Caloramator sp.]
MSVEYIYKRLLGFVGLLSFVLSIGIEKFIIPKNSKILIVV